VGKSVGDSSELVAALSQAQGEFTEITKDKTNTFFKSKYATLDAVIKATRPILCKHGLAVTHHFEEHSERPVLVTTLHHVSGETVHSSIPIIAGDGMQGLGSAITYARRYNLCGLLNVAADEDDDGNAAHTETKATPAKRSQPKKAAAKKVPQKDLVARAKSSFAAAGDGAGILEAVAKIGEYRDGFPSVASYTEALAAAYAHKESCTGEEWEEIKKRVTFYVNCHPENKSASTEAALNAEADAAFS